MVSKTGSRLRKSARVSSDQELADQIGNALRKELGGSRRATKTIMRWTGVSDKTARSWLFGNSSPNGFHMIALAGNSELVMKIVLERTGYSSLSVGLELVAIEQRLEVALNLVRELIDRSRT